MTERRAPPDATPATCPHCDAPFPTDRLRDLHVGHSHLADATDRERTAYEDALDADEDDLRMFQYVALAALVLVYFFFLMTYAAVT